MPILIIQMLLTCLLGWAVGILINLLADVLPTQRRLAAPICRQCEQELPLASYLPWPRPCPHCERLPRPRNWLVQILACLSTTWIWFQPVQGLGFMLSLLILAYFGLVMVIDVEHRLVLRVTSLAGLALGLAAGWMRLGLASCLLGGLAAFLILLAIYFLGRLFGTVLGKLHGRATHETPFGFGDVMLGMVIGLIVGWPGILHSLLVAILLTGAFILVYLPAMLALRRYPRGSAITYAPVFIQGALWVNFSN